LVVVLVLLANLDLILNRRLWPDVTSSQIDSAAALDGIALEHAGELIKVDRQWAQQWGRPTESRIKHIRELLVTFPVALTQRRHAFASQSLGAVNTLVDGSEEPIADQLKRMLRPWSLPQ
jgi:hypothetical protein